jgi:cytochrome P450
MKPSYTAPGPRGRDTARILAGFLTRPLEQYRRLAAYGDAVEFSYAAGRRRFVLFSRPECVEHILVKNQDNYVKAFTYRALRIFLGDGLVTAEGDTWRRHRRIVQPVFARRNVTALAPAMAAGAEKALNRWVDGEIVPVTRSMSALTLDVVGRALFGSDVFSSDVFSSDVFSSGRPGSGSGPSGETARLARALSRIQSTVVLAAFVPSLWTDNGIRRATRATRGFGGMIDAIDRPVNAMIARHRAHATVDSSDLLGLLMAARDEDGSALSDREIRDEVATFMLAGHETTAVALSWALALLSTHPQDRERLEEEVDEVLAGRVPGPADVGRLPWTNALISEVMRLYPPAWTIERDAIADDEIGGVRIPAGAIVAVPPYLVHRHPETWDNPEGFDPRRFLAKPAVPRHRLAYLPFGAGRRGCVGAGFAQLEAVIVLAMIVQRYRLDLIGEMPRPHEAVTLRPGGPMPMRVHRRAT